MIIKHFVMDFVYDSQTFCYGLNVWVALKFICGSPNPQCDVFGGRAHGW